MSLDTLIDLGTLFVFVKLIHNSLPTVQDWPPWTHAAASDQIEPCRTQETMEGECHSLLNVQIKHSGYVSILSVLIDPRPAGNFMGHDTIMKHNIPTQPLQHPLKINATDGGTIRNYSHRVLSHFASNPFSSKSVLPTRSPCPSSSLLPLNTTLTLDPPGCTFMTCRFHGIIRSSQNSHCDVSSLFAPSLSYHCVYHSRAPWCSSISECPQGVS